MKQKLLLFGGTTEAREIAESGLPMICCVATEYGAEVLHEAPGLDVRTGRLDAAGMAALIREEEITVVADATHPYARAVTAEIKKACAETGAQVLDYSAAPVFMDEHAKCRHQWLIEFARMPDDLARFARVLDDTLKEVNSDYEAKRQNDLALQPLEVIVARPGLFHDWLAQKGKLGGQHKIPRLSNTREYIEEMLKLNK